MMFRTSELLLFIALLIAPNLRGGHHLDSLKRSLLSAPDADKIDLLLEIGDSLQYSLIDESRKHYETALNLARIQNDLPAKARVLCHMSFLEWEKGNFQHSLDLENQALQIYRSLDDLEGQANTTMGLGIAYSEMGMQQLAVEHYLIARDLYEQIADTVGLCYLNLNLGASYSDLRDSTLAMKHYREALKWSDLGGDEGDRADILQNMGNSMSEAGDEELAYRYYREAIELYERHGIISGLALCMTNLAGTQMNLDSLQEAEISLINAIKLAEESQDTPTLCYALNNLGDLYNRLRRYEEADRKLSMAMEIAKSNGFIHDIRDNLKYRSDWYHCTGNQVMAFVTLSEYTELKDSIDSSNHLGQISNMALLFETEKRDRQIKILKTEMERDALEAEKKNLAIAGFGVVILLSMGGIVAFWLAYRKKQRFTGELEDKQLELTRINARLESEKMRAEESGKAKAEFLSMMSHELRTPLNAVVGIANLLDEKKTDRLNKDSVRTLKLASGNLLRLINDILDYNKIESGNIDFEKYPIRIEGLMEDVLCMYKQEADLKGITLSLNLSDKVPETIVGDPTRLTQILSNLVSNAIKFTDAGFVRVYAEINDSIPESPMLRLVVKDTGIGISPEKHEVIFESFSQAESSTTRKYGGSGLGLAICKDLIELQGGSIKLESDSGMGATFIVELPLLHAADLAEGLEELESLEKGRAELQDHRVLLVDDNELNLFVARSILDGLGMLVTTAAGGEEAVELMKRSEFDLVLMDLQMPGLDGFQAAKLGKESNPDLPIIALSAGSKEDLLQHQDRKLFTSFLRKPFEIDELVSVMYGSLQKKRAA